MYIYILSVYTIGWCLGGMVCLSLGSAPGLTLGV